MRLPRLGLIPWLTSLLAFQLSRAQVFQYTEITLSQYDAQKVYETWQRSDITYEDWMWREGYSECIDDPKSYLESGSLWTCDTMSTLMGCSGGNLTEIFGDNEGLIPVNTTVQELCPKTCAGCKRVAYFKRMAIVRSTDLWCAMRAIHF